MTWGMPALGMQEIRPGKWRPRYRMWDFIPSGPVAQFRPREKTGKGSMAAAAAATSEPTSMVPELSTVRDTMTGMSRPSRSSSSKQETSPIFTCRRSWHVSNTRRSTPAKTSARICPEYARAISSEEMCPREGSFVVGPIEPATYPRPPCRAMAARAFSTAARFISSTRLSSPYSARTTELAPNVFVSRTIAPAARNDACSSVMASGAERFRYSLHPSYFPHADGGRERPCRFVPHAPSKMSKVSSKRPTGSPLSAFPFPGDWKSNKCPILQGKTPDVKPSSFWLDFREDFLILINRKLHTVYNLRALLQTLMFRSFTAARTPGRDGFTVR
jgi:hypothetical protein